MQIALVTDAWLLPQTNEASCARCTITGEQLRDRGAPPSRSSNRVCSAPFLVPGQYPEIRLALLPFASARCQLRTRPLRSGCRARRDRGTTAVGGAARRWYAGAAVGPSRRRTSHAVPGVRARAGAGAAGAGRTRTCERFRGAAAHAGCDARPMTRQLEAHGTTSRAVGRLASIAEVFAARGEQLPRPAATDLALLRPDRGRERVVEDFLDLRSAGRQAGRRCDGPATADCCERRFPQAHYAGYRATASSWRSYVSCADAFGYSRAAPTRSVSCCVSRRWRAVSRWQRIRSRARVTS